MKRFFAVLIGTFTPISAHAVPVRLTDYWSCTGFLRCGSAVGVVDFLINSLIDGVQYFIAPLATVVFFYGALRMIFSRGEEGKEVGKKALIYASIGLATSILVAGVIQYVCVYLYQIGGSPTTTCPALIWSF